MPRCPTNTAELCGLCGSLGKQVVPIRSQSRTAVATERMGLQEPKVPLRHSPVQRLQLVSCALRRRASAGLSPAHLTAPQPRQLRRPRDLGKLNLPGRALSRVRHCPSTTTTLAAVCLPDASLPTVEMLGLEVR